MSMRQRNCPRCQAVLTVSTSVPEKLICPTCAAAIRLQTPAGSSTSSSVQVMSMPPQLPEPAVPAIPLDTAHAVPATPATPRPRWLWGTLALVVLLTGAGVFWLLQGEGTEPVIQPGPELAVQETAHDRAVRVAIGAGAVYLKKRLNEGNVTTSDARFPDRVAGVTALMGLALLEAGAAPTDPTVQKALAFVRRESDRLNTIYVLGAAMFFLNRLNEVGALNEIDQAIVRSLALRLIAGQMPSGQWGYANPPLPALAEADLLKKLRSGQYKPSGRVQFASNSMTQFGMLSLWGARKTGVPVRAPLMAVALQFHTTQLPDGAWHYSTVEPNLVDANTCAGLLALAVEQALRYDREFAEDLTFLPAPNEKVEEIRKKAFQRLAKVVGRKQGDPQPHPSSYMGGLFGAAAWGDCYFLWSLERVAVIYDLKMINGKDWYQWGSEVLVKAQQKDGSWSDRHGADVDTAFALLFLTRANLARDLTDKLKQLLALQRQRALLAAPWQRERT